MRLMLAPMEGVVDHTMRDLLTSLGGVDRCVTEFVRVSDRLLPPRVFRRLCPELDRGGVTASGVPVYVQILGGQAQVVAENAARAAQLGAPGVDLNFGCPARTVNRSDGGSIILREPERVHAIVAAARKAVPAAVPLTRGGANNTVPTLEACAEPPSPARRPSVPVVSKAAGVPHTAHSTLNSHRDTFGEGLCVESGLGDNTCDNVVDWLDHLGPDHHCLALSSLYATYIGKGRKG